MKIGQFLFRYMDRTPVNWEEELRLGDLFVEAFYNCGFINIDYPARRDSSHIVRGEVPAGLSDVSLVKSRCITCIVTMNMRLICSLCSGYSLRSMIPVFLL